MLPIYLLEGWALGGIKVPSYLSNAFLPVILLALVGYNSYLYADLIVRWIIEKMSSI